MRGPAVTVVLVAALTMVLTGCSGTKPDPPGQTSSKPPDGAANSSSTPQALPYAGAPKVATPLPNSVLTGGPCAALTAQQVKDGIGVNDPGKPDTVPGIGARCVWSNVETSGQVLVYYVTETGKGLSGLYENTKPQSVVWKPLPAIQGFPAVAYVSSSGGDPKDFCAVSVGIADNLTVEAAMFLGRSKRGKVDPCTIAPLEANDVVTTLRGKVGV
ncbi:DUF3558 domain-containing protein [Amycolatopsis sp. NPDC059027]|uniref:DUF3558 domain-containing protein n=1 Tax=Amycolatopsis sp. NPDC059027 TaxID=3346709 RepID=UPI00366D979A